MYPNGSFSRRHFVGGAAAALGAIGLKPGADLYGRGFEVLPTAATGPFDDEYDALAKLDSNEHHSGPSASVMEAMNGAWKYSMRYGYPDGNIQAKIAEHHGVGSGNILLGAGSREILRVVGLTFLAPGKKVVGVEPSYGTVFQHASGIRAESIQLPLEPDFSQNIQRMIDVTNRNHRDVGFIYLCNPNNPTGRSVSASEVRELLDGIPEDVPVLIDEAYHHFVQDPEYATSLPYVLEGRPVIIARTFSKIYGLAAMRLGYAVASEAMIDRMATYSTGNVNVLVKWGGAKALEDTAAEAESLRYTLETRKSMVAELESMDFEVIPTETNFMMVHIGRPVREVIDAFRAKDELVGRPCPPLDRHLRVSVASEEHVDRFFSAWKEIFRTTSSTGSRLR